MNIEKLLKVRGELEKVYPVLGVKDLYNVEAKYSHHVILCPPVKPSAW